jgi:hypothetical protein
MSSVYYFKFEEKHEDSSYVTIIGKEFQVFWMSYDFTSLWLYKQTSTSTSLHTHGEKRLNPILHTAWLFNNHALTLESNTVKYYFGEKSSFLHTFLKICCESRKIYAKLKYLFSMP